MSKEASYVTLSRFRCHWGNKIIGVFRKKCHFSFYCLNGNENASTASIKRKEKKYYVIRSSGNPPFFNIFSAMLLRNH